eukprot:gene4808-9589_t
MIPSISSNNNSALCPISSLFHIPDFKNPQIHSYPIDIFARQSGQHPHNSQQQYICAAHDKSRTQRHICPEISICPIDFQNLIDANKSKKNKFKISTSFCKLFELLQDPSSTVHIIILGGSVTSGTYTGGCCCTHEFDKKCPHNINPSHMDKSCDFNSEYTNFNSTKACSWPTLLHRWLQHIFPSQIHMVNLSSGGRTSTYTAETIISDLRYKGIFSVNSSFLFILDHSINDAFSHPTKITNIQLFHSLENLLQRIYYISLNGSWPTVILLEHWPYASNNMYANTPNASSTSTSNSGFDGDYSIPYAAISSKYSIPLWSYKNIIWSEYMLQNQNSYVKPLRFHMNKMHPRKQDVHPPWYVHLYYADMIAGLISLEMKRCHIKTHGSGNCPWRLYEDRPGKGGWIAEYNSINDNNNNGNTDSNHSYHQSTTVQSNTTKTTKTTTTSTSTSIIIICNSSISFISNPITFLIKPSTSTSTSTAISTSHLKTYNKYNNNNTNQINNNDNISGKYLLSIHYFKSYENVGYIEVYLCNRHILSLDSLWKDFESYRISMNTIQYYEIIDIGRVSSMDLPRGTQKVKIVNVKLTKCG